jgi:hypothetical protein
MLRILVLNSILLFFLTSCTLYESGGRQAIEKNENNLVGSYAAGLSAKHQHYYVCSHTKELPDFLLEALEVIETPHETRNFSILLNARTTPKWIAVYRHNLELNTHEQCKIYFLNNQPINKKRILIAANIGVQKISELSNSAR